jgi:uncharacterized protein YndB with AHSA1/START domain
MSTATFTRARTSDTEFVMERTIEASPECVFDAYTDPVKVAQWWGQRSSTTTVEQNDVRPGGAWRFVQRDAEGNVYEFYGQYLEVVPNQKLVYTFEFAGFPGHVVTDTVAFELEGAGTRLVASSSFTCKEDLDGMLATGMEGGANESWDRLAELLAR